jgi:hypothetical protein
LVFREKEGEAVSASAGLALLREKISSRVRRITGGRGFGRGASRERTSSALASISGASVIASARAARRAPRAAPRAFRPRKVADVVLAWNLLPERRVAFVGARAVAVPAATAPTLAKALDMTFGLGACVPSPTNAARQ